MPNVPATLADLQGDFMFAQRVELLIGSTEDGNTAGDKMLAMYGQHMSIRHPRSRFNHGLTRSYGHGAPDITMDFSIHVTHDLVPYLRTRSLRDSSGELPIYKYAMKMTSNDGTAKTMTVSGKMEGVDYDKREGDQENPVSVRCSVLVTDSELPSS